MSLCNCSLLAIWITWLLLLYEEIVWLMKIEFSSILDYSPNIEAPGKWKYKFRVQPNWKGIYCRSLRSSCRMLGNRPSGLGRSQGCRESQMTCEILAPGIYPLNQTVDNVTLIARRQWHKIIFLDAPAVILKEKNVRRLWHLSIRSYNSWEIENHYSSQYLGLG